MKTIILKATLVCGLAIGAMSCKKDLDNLKRNDYLIEKITDTYTYKYFDGTDTVEVIDESETVFKYSDNRLDKVTFGEDSSGNYVKFLFADDELSKIEFYDDNELSFYAEIDINKDKYISEMRFFEDTTSSFKLVRGSKRISVFERIIHKALLAQRVGNSSGTPVLVEKYQIKYDDKKLVQLDYIDVIDNNTLYDRDRFTTDKDGNVTKLQYFDPTDGDKLYYTENYTLDKKITPFSLLGNAQFIFGGDYNKANILKSSGYDEDDPTDLYEFNYTYTYNSDDYATSITYVFSGGSDKSTATYQLKKN